MLSLQDIAAVKFAVVICNESELKRKILSEPESLNISGNKYQKWNEMVEKQAMVTLRRRGLPKSLQEKVMGVVPAIGMRMLTWTRYHKNILMFSCQYSIDFLNSSFFTQQGIIDSKKVAEELMKDKNLSVEQKYKIACLYCFTDHIPALFKQLAKEDREMFCSSGSRSYNSQPELVRFWSDYLMGVVDKVRGGKTLDQYRLDKAIESGSKPAVEYCFEKTNLRMEKEAIVDAAVDAVVQAMRNSNSMIAWGDSTGFLDWMNNYYNHSVNWVPSEYYTDIVFFLFSKMREEQRIEFLKKDIEGVKYERNNYEEHHNRSRVLEYFLNWPYQDYFMKTASLMWEFLPEYNYADLLLKICDKIEPEEEENLKFDEEKSHDYRGLLMAFWHQSPERYKRYVLCNQRIPCQVLINLLSLKKFTFEDVQIIGIILASAMDNEKEAILSSDRWARVLYEVIKEDNLEILARLDRCVLRHFSSMRGNECKRKLILSTHFYRVVFHFVKNDKWDAVESALKWSSLSGEEVTKLKKEMIYSRDGKLACLNLCVEGVEAANKFIEWCIPSEEEIREYKENLIFSFIGMKRCKSLVLEDKVELIDKIANCWLFAQEKIKQFKDEFQSLMGYNICEQLISGSDTQFPGYSERWLFSHSGYTFKFEGGKWEEVEKFVTWCFSSEEEIVDFKKRLFKDSGKAILLNLIASSRWAEAETFFAWLGLSIDEIKELKKDTVLDSDFFMFFRELMRSEDLDPSSVYYGSRKEAIELILRLCLTDKEAVLEFQHEFKKSRMGLNFYDREYLRYVLGNFDLMIEQHLKDMHEEETGVKRKSEAVFTPNKLLCNFKLENFD